MPRSSTYVDNAFNRKAGRVGKPLGSVPISRTLRSAPSNSPSLPSPSRLETLRSYKNETKMASESILQSLRSFNKSTSPQKFHELPTTRRKSSSDYDMKAIHSCRKYHGHAQHEGPVTVKQELSEIKNSTCFSSPTGLFNPSSGQLEKSVETPSVDTDDTDSFFMMEHKVWEVEKEEFMRPPISGQIEDQLVNTVCGFAVMILFMMFVDLLLNPRSADQF